ncbi:MAG: CoB--CoM heterodisulfide reductase iron-sulfur subunit A family protein [Promethearchaeota archaeon]
MEDEKKSSTGDEEVRVGVFVCHCGTNIGGVVDCEALAKFASTLPGVVHAEDNMYTCSEVGLNRIKEMVKEHGLNRVVVASCTPRTHEPLFRETISQVGLNPYLFEMVNIRDQCTWVHMDEPEKAYEKAEDLIKMGVGKARLLRPLEKYKVEVTPSAVVIGAGIGGITAALNLANQGVRVFVLEKDSELGGFVRNLNRIFPSDVKAPEFIGEKVADLERNPNVEIIKSASIRDVSGFVGNYNLEVESPSGVETIKAGAIIIATGARVLPADEVPEFSGSSVIDQAALELALRTGEFGAKNVVMIQCAGSRNEERPYCSGICCTTALKNALLIKEEFPDTRVTILYRDIQALGTRAEALYERARVEGINFVMYSPDKIPTIKEDRVVVHNVLLGIDMGIPRDLVVLSTPLVAREDSLELAQYFKVPRGSNSFFLEAHVKLRPVDFATDGVFVCGSARWPSSIPDTVVQALAAASRASTILSHEFFEVEGSTAEVPEWNKNLCKGCEVCLNVCPFGAIKKDENDEIEIIQVLCKGCGTCGASCPHNAIVIKHFTNEQLLTQIAELARGVKEV